MAKRIPISGLNREEWLKMRKTGIGGSDAGAVCGMNPYESPMTVYLDKTSDEVTEWDSEAMRQGRDLEAYVARRFMEATGKKVRRSRAIYQRDGYPFMLADVDRLLVGEDAGLECKTANAYQEDQWKDGKIPPHYMTQCYHYMAVTGKKSWYIAVILLGLGFQYTKLSWDEGIIQSLTAVEADFWQNHVLAKVPPEPDGSKACDEALQKYFHSRKGPVIPLEGFDEKLERRDAIIKQVEQLETEQRQIEQSIKLFMAENEKAASARYRVSWANVETRRLDTTRLKLEAPETYNQFSHVTTGRRFTVKAA